MTENRNYKAQLRDSENAGKSEELKPCPFCGKKPTVDLHSAIKKSDGAWQVFCEFNYCFVKPHIGYFYDKINVIKAWNTRPHPPELEVFTSLPKSNDVLEILKHMRDIYESKGYFSQSNALDWAIKKKGENEVVEALKALLVAVCYNTKIKEFGKDNPCWEARVPVQFVEDAHKALKNVGRGEG